MQPAVTAATDHNKSVGAKLQLSCDFFRKFMSWHGKIS